MSAPAAHDQRNSDSGYWGRNLARRSVGNAVIQLHEASAPPEVVVAHGHTNAHIIFVASGCYISSVTGDNGFTATPVAVINPPGTWHRDRFTDGRGSFMSIDLAIDGLAEDHVRLERQPQALHLLHRLAACLSIASDLELEECPDGLADQFGGAPIGDASLDAVSLAYQAIMDAATPQELRMAELARLSGVHPNHLPRAFRRQFGVTASQLARRRQAELAGRTLATESHSSIAQIAAEHGYCDQAHFSHSFKRQTGLTPLQWRQRA